MNFKDNILNIQGTMADAMVMIDQRDIKICFIVDEQERLCGTVTDGDLRRALLAGKTMKDSVAGIMNSRPRYFIDGQYSSQDIDKLIALKIVYVPIVNLDKQVVQVLHLATHQTLKKDNVVVLMAGGFGKRLSPMTDTTPKPLLKVGGVPILETIIRNFKNHGFYKFVISVNYLSDKIKEHFKDGSSLDVEIQYLDETSPMGTCGSLSALKQQLKEPFIVMNGDVLTNLNFSKLMDFHLERKSIATMCVREHEFQVPYGVVSFDGDQLVSIDEKPIHKFFVNAGIYVLSTESLNFIPENKYYDMPTLFSDLRSKNKKVAGYLLKEYWLDIGHPEDFLRAQVEFSKFFQDPV